MKENANNQTLSVLSDRRLRLAIITIAVWALIQMTRLTAFSITQSVLARIDSTAWLYPAYVDMLIGITAPFVAFVLWRRTGIGVWVAVLIWFTISLFDHMDAIAAALISPIPQAFFGGNQSGVLISLLISTLLDRS